MSGGCRRPGHWHAGRITRLSAAIHCGCPTDGDCGGIGITRLLSAAFKSNIQDCESRRMGSVNPILMRQRCSIQLFTMVTPMGHHPIHESLEPSRWPPTRGWSGPGERGRGWADRLAAKTGRNGVGAGICCGTLSSSRSASMPPILRKSISASWNHYSKSWIARIRGRSHFDMP